MGSRTKSLFFCMLRNYSPQHTASCMNRLSTESSRFLQLYGFSIGIADVTATPQLKHIQSELIGEDYADCDE